MHTQIKDRVFKALDDKKRVVFPNEEAKRRFLSFYVREKKRPILESSGIAFDALYDEILIKDKKSRMVEEVERLLFSFSLLDRIGSSLSSFYRREYPYLAEHSARYISSLLPSLKSIVDKMSFSSNSSIYSELILIYREYVSFLEKNSLYERSYLDVDIEKAKNDIFLLPYSNPVEAYVFLTRPEFKDLNVIDSAESHPTLTAFNNERIEVRELFLKLRELLDGGLYTDEIAISAVDVDRLRPILERESLLFDVPLSFVGGESLKSQFPGKLITSLIDIYDNNYRIKDLKAFFLDPEFKFENRSALRSFIDKAIRFNITGAPSREGIKRGQKDRYREIKSIFDYSRFRDALDNLMNETRENEIIKRMQILLSNLFGSYRFEDDGKKSASFSFFQDRLEECLERVAKLRKSGIKRDKKLFAILSNMILSHRYVERDKKEGISVYPYSLGYASPYRHHFVINLSEKGAKTTVGHSSFFNEYIQQYIKDGERDISQKIIDSYESVNEDVSLYFAYRTSEGEELPLSILMNSIEDGKIDLVDSYQEEEKEDEERRGSVYPLQALSHKALNLSSPDFDRKGVKIEHPTISYSALKDYKECHFKYILKRIYKLKELYFFSEENNLELGTRMHSICERYFRYIRENENKSITDFFEEEMSLWMDGKRFLYDRKMGREETVDMESGANIPSSSDIAFIRSVYLKGLKSLVSKIEDEAPVGPEDLLESDMKLDFSEYALTGKEDRIARLKDGSGYVFFDYKLSKNKSVDENQFLVYKLLFGKEREAIAKFAFIKEGKESKEISLKDTSQIESDLSDMASGLKEGDWSLSSDIAICRECPYKGICRRGISPR